MSYNWTCKAAVFQLEPFNIYRQLENGRWDLRGGRYGSVSKAIFQSINVTCEYYMAEGKSLGGVGKDGVWTGALGLMNRKETNIFWGPSVTSLNYMKAGVSPIVSFYAFEMTFFAAVGREAQLNPMGLLATFPLEIWVTVIAAVTVSSLTLKLVEPKRLHLPPFMYTIPWICMNSVSTSRFVDASTKLSARILIAFYLLFIILVTNYFNTDLISSLTLKLGAPRIESLEEFLSPSYDSVPAWLFKHSSAQFFLENAQGDTLKRLWAKISRDQSAIPVGGFYNDRMLTAVSEGKETYFADSVSGKHNAAQFCSANEKTAGVFYNPFSLYQSTAGAQIHNDEPQYIKDLLYWKYRAVFEANLVEHTFPDDQFRPSFSKCQQKKSATDAVKPLAYDQLLSVFILYGVGMFLSAVCSCLERLSICLSGTRKYDVERSIRISRGSAEQLFDH